VSEVSRDCFLLNDGFLTTPDLTAIIDSGTTLVVGDTSNVAKFWKAAGGKDASSTVGEGFYTYPCNSPPSVSITFGGKKFAISADTLSLGPVSSGSSQCVGGIVGQDLGVDFWIVGDVFMRNVYTVSIGSILEGDLDAHDDLGLRSRQQPSRLRRTCLSWSGIMTADSIALHGLLDCTCIIIPTIIMNASISISTSSRTSGKSITDTTCSRPLPPTSSPPASGLALSKSSTSECP
jgi:hypothetical protein